MPTGQSRDRSRKLIDTILSLSHSLESLKGLLANSQAELGLLLSTDPLASMGRQSELTDRITAEEASIRCMEERIQQKEAELR
jgi:ABC-type transporter Mla subunit MlaD